MSVPLRDELGSPGSVADVRQTHFSVLLPVSSASVADGCVRTAQCVFIFE